MALPRLPSAYELVQQRAALIQGRFGQLFHQFVDLARKIVVYYRGVCYRRRPRHQAERDGDGSQQYEQSDEEYTSREVFSKFP